MKKPKRINSKRPSLWKCRATGAIRVLYSSGYVELYNSYRGKWVYSFYSDPDPEMAIQDLKTDNTFVGYL